MAFGVLSFVSAPYLLATADSNPLFSSDGTLGSMLASFGIDLQSAVAVILLIPAALVLVRAVMYATERLRSVRITPTQFPEAYRMVAEAAREHGLRRMPDAYVVAGEGVLNAYAAGHGHRRYVTVTSDMLELGGELRDPDALRFVIGHEVGHIAAGHVGYFRLVFANAFMSIPVLGAFFSRAQEYTADNYGYAYCPEGAAGAMRVLSSGKYLNQATDFDEFADRATTERGLFIWAANLTLGHPALTWRAAALRDRGAPGRIFLRPRFTPSGVGSLQDGSSRSAQWPDPDQALAYLDQHPPAVPSFPAPAVVGGAVPAIVSQQRTEALTGGDAPEGRS